MSTTLPISPAEAARLADDLESRSAEDVLRVAVELFHPRLVLTCSWQKQSSVLVHMLSEIQPDVRVVEFDTGLLFRETYETRQKLIERYPVRFERIEPELSVA
jgi:phosphoadenosine phosphosulfate reductase